MTDLNRLAEKYRKYENTTANLELELGGSSDAAKIREAQEKIEILKYEMHRIICEMDSFIQQSARRK